MGIKGERKGRWERDSGNTRMAVTVRDEAIVTAVAGLRYVTLDHIRDLFFSAGARSNCQRRLTLLYNGGFIDKLKGRAASEPDVYCLSREAPAGLKLLRRNGTKRDLLRPASSTPQLQHVLGVNDVYCRLTRACRECGLELTGWRSQADLSTLGNKAGAIPDGFFVVRKRVEGGALTSACMLEMERSPRSPRTMLRKYTRLREFYENGSYERSFGHRTLRCLVVTSQLSIKAEQRWATTLSRLAESAGLSFGWFASLREILATEPAALLEAPIWRRPRADVPVALGALAVPRDSTQ